MFSVKLRKKKDMLWRHVDKTMLDDLLAHISKVLLSCSVLFFLFLDVKFSQMNNIWIQAGSE